MWTHPHTMYPRPLFLPSFLLEKNRPGNEPSVYIAVKLNVYVWIFLRKTAVITKIDLCTTVIIAIAMAGRPASSNSDFDEALAYALRCVQLESLTLNEHFRDIFLYFH